MPEISIVKRAKIRACLFGLRSSTPAQSIYAFQEYILAVLGVQIAYRPWVTNGLI